MSTESKVALLHPGHRRHFPVRTRHVLGDHPANASQRLAATLAGRAARGSRAHVLFRDAPLRAGPGQAVEVDAELLGNLADEGRRAGALRRKDVLPEKADAR